MTGSISPETFGAALDALDTMIPTATKHYLRSLDETGLHREHWGLGIAVRNVLGLWRDDSALARWFGERGVIRADDMSSEILRAYWRRLRGLAPEAEPGELESLEIERAVEAERATATPQFLADCLP